MPLTTLEETQLRQLLLNYEGLDDVGTDAAALQASLLAGDVIVTDLPAAAPLASEDVLYVAQSGADVKASIQQFADFVTSIIPSLTTLTINTTGGNHVITAPDSLSRRVVVNGALTSNSTLVFPAATGEWTIINNTTGAFSVTAIASGGSGVPIFQGGVDTVVCDGTNVRYEDSSALTRSLGDSTKAIATTEFVANAVASGINATQLYYFAQF